METYSVALKRAREEKGLTASQVASKTHLLVQVVEDLEAERFKSVPAPIYGRGFVRLYAECVGLDPAPLVADFMAAYNGTRPKIPACVQMPDAPAAEPAPQADAVADEPTAAGTQSLGQFPKSVEPAADEPLAAVDEPPPTSHEPPPASHEQTVTPIAEPPPIVTPFAAKPVEPIDEPPPVVRGLDLFEQARRVERVREEAKKLNGGMSGSPYVTSATYEPERGRASMPPPDAPRAKGPSAAERFRGGLSSVSHGVLGQAKQIPPSVWRISLLAVAASAVISLVAWACVVLYRFTENGMPEEDFSPTRQAPIAAAAAPAAKSAAPAAAKPNREMRSTGGRKIPQLYVD